MPLSPLSQPFRSSGRMLLRPWGTRQGLWVPPLIYHQVSEIGQFQGSAPKYALNPEQQHPSSSEGLLTHPSMCMAPSELAPPIWKYLLLPQSQKTLIRDETKWMRLHRTNVQWLCRGSVEKKPPRLFIDSSATIFSLILERRLGSASPHTLQIPNAGPGLQKDFRHILDTVITNNQIIFCIQKAELQN